MIKLKSKALIFIASFGLFFPVTPSLADSSADYRDCIGDLKRWIDRKGALGNARAQQLAESYCQRNQNDLKESCLNSSYREGFGDSKMRNKDAIEFAINQCQNPLYYVPPVK